jgi:16S rRNA (guanine966-N2)-methyltransferase
MGEAALNAALAGGWIADNALIVWEESAEITPSDGLTLLDERRYGDTMIRVLERG